MIEIIKEETVEEKDERQERGDGKTLPKNIRQIGESDSFERIYIEDYVMTHMKQLAAYGDDTPKVLILYGNRRMIDNMLVWFISGAVQAEVIDPFMEKIVFDEKAWRIINERASLFFRELSVVGWALLRKNVDAYWDDKIIVTHKEFFRVDQKVYFEYIMNERIENMYLFEEGRMEKQPGYYVYYEKNEPMQNYMLSYKEIELPNDVQEKETEPSVDRATKQFRTIAQEKKDSLHKRNTTTLLYGTSAVLIMVIMVIGITMLNNYEKMQNMEKVLYQISGKIDEEGDVVATGGSQLSNTKMTNADNDTVSLEEGAGLQISTDSKTAQNTDAGSRDDAQNDIHNKSEDTANNKSSDASGTSDNGAEEPDDISDDAAEEPVHTSGDAPNESGDALDTSGTPDNSGETSDNSNSTSDTSANANSETPDTNNTSSNTNGDQNSTASNEGEGEVASNTDANSTKVSSPWEYTIKKGDTLVKISYRYYGNGTMVSKICELNNITDIDNIKYGEKLLLP